MSMCLHCRWCCIVDRCSGRKAKEGGTRPCLSVSMLRPQGQGGRYPPLSSCIVVWMYSALWMWITSDSDRHCGIHRVAVHLYRQCMWITSSEKACGLHRVKVHVDYIDSAWWITSDSDSAWWITSDSDSADTSTVHCELQRQ